MRISTNRMRCYLRCAEEFRLRYVLNRMPKIEDENREATDFGSLMHEAQLAWWEEGGHRAGAMRVLREQSPDEMTRVKAETLMAGYHARWAPEHGRYESIGCEHEFNLQVDDTSWTLFGRIDGLVKDIETDEVLLREFKTTNQDISPGSFYWRKLTYDLQVTNYLIGCRQLGYEVTGVLYDVIAKPNISPHKATPPAKRKYRRDGGLYKGMREEDETSREYGDRLKESLLSDPEAYYQRQIVVRLEDELKEKERALIKTARDMLKVSQDQPETCNDQSCWRYGRYCPYLRACAGEINVMDDTRFEPRLEK